MAAQRISRSTGTRGTAQPPRSRAFFLELLLNMLIFALCAAVTMQVFAEGKLTTDEAAALTTLTLNAESLAETYKALDGDLDSLTLFHGGQEVTGELTGAGALVYYYDRDLELTTAENARNILVLSPVASGHDLVETIEITGYAGEDELFSFEVSRFQPSEREVEDAPTRQ